MSLGYLYLETINFLVKLYALMIRFSLYDTNIMNLTFKAPNPQAFPWNMQLFTVFSYNLVQTIYRVNCIEHSQITSRILNWSLNFKTFQLNPQVKLSFQSSQFLSLDMIGLRTCYILSMLTIESKTINWQKDLIRTIVGYSHSRIQLKL